MRLELFLILMLILPFTCGCSDQGMSETLQVFLEADTLGTQAVVQTELPAEVWTQMRKQAEEDFSWIDNRLRSDSKEKWVFDLQQTLIRNGAEDIDLQFLLALHKDYYNRYIDAEGIAIVGNAAIEDKHYIEARTIVLTMTAKHPELRDRLLARLGFYMIIYPVQFEDNKVPELYLYSNLLGTPVVTLGSCRQSASLETPTVSGYCFASVTGGGKRLTKSTDPHEYTYMMTFVHEFAHALETEIRRLDPNFENRLKQAYDTSIALETWGLGSKAAVNWAEYWAEGVVYWFYDIGEGRWFESRKAFAKRDPLLAELLDEWFIRATLPTFSL